MFSFLKIFLLIFIVLETVILSLLFIFDPGFNPVSIKIACLLTPANGVIAFFLSRFQKSRHVHTSQLLKEKERYQSLYNAVTDAVMVAQLTPAGHLGRFIEVNETACRQYGYSMQEMCQLTLRDLTSPECDPEEWRKHLDSEIPFQQKRRTRKDETLWVETRIHRMDYDTIPAVMFLDHDLTSLNATMHQLKQAKTQAESANHAKSAFLANMSHEIRTPMNAILGYTQLLRRDRTLNSIAREHLEIIHRSGEHLLALINDILELSKIEAGRIQITDEIFDMERLMKDLEQMFQLRVKQKGLCFAVESSWEFKGNIQADQGKIRQILINILGNAVKFTDDGGIIIRYGAVRNLEHGNRIKVWVEVEDTGKGIASEEISKVFRPFEQAESGISEGGTGLGMAISREYARVMSGDITVRSKQGVGSTFRLEFQAENSEEPLEDTLDHTTIIRLMVDREYSILVVDDREHNRKLLKTLLENNGFQVITAADGLEAVELFKNETPHLVMLDLKMPIMNGYEAAVHIRTLPGGETTPMFLITASTSDSSLPELGREVFHSIIRKPFKDTEILSAIRDALRLDYRYEYEPKIPASVYTTTQMRVSSRIIPGQAKADMLQAVQGGDMDLFEQLIEVLAEEHPLMAARLKQYADSFDYDKLILILSDQDEQI